VAIDWLLNSDRRTKRSAISTTLQFVERKATKRRKREKSRRKKKQVRKEERKGRRGKRVA
jgi:hypothetical protein